MIGPNDLKDLQKQFQQDPQIESLPEEEYLVEHLDYKYIGNCTDIKELQLLQNVLQGGKEGFYPQLLEFLKERIQAIQPVENEIVDFVNLANELKEMESSLQEKTNKQWTENKSQNFKETKSKIQNQRIKSDDYRAWEKLDLDKELEKIDSCDIMIKEGKLSELPNIESKLNMDISKIKLKSKGETEVLAEQEKIKGNECFKAQEYNDAIVYYTRSLQLLKRAHVFTNRANAFLKIGQYERAEMDSSAALELNDTLYIFKAYVRRAEARRKRGKLWDALQDIESALKVDPKSNLAINLRTQIEAEYKKVEGDLAKDTRGSKTRIKIEEEASVVELQPSSITEVTDEEAHEFIPQKTSNEEDVNIQKIDEFIQGLQTLTPTEKMAQVNQNNENGSTEKRNLKNDSKLKIQDNDKVDDGCESKSDVNLSTSNININDKEEIDDDCCAFEKELMELNSKVAVSDMEKVDKDCETFLDELLAADSKILIEDVEEMDDDCSFFAKTLEGTTELEESAHESENVHLKDNCNHVSSESRNISFFPPKSSVEFETTWNSIKGDVKLFASYLSCIQDSELKRFLGLVNNADLHIDLILSTEFMTDAVQILDYLEFLVTLPRFKVVKSFMIRKQKAQLSATLIKLKSGINDKRIDLLMTSYNV